MAVLIFFIFISLSCISASDAEDTPYSNFTQLTEIIDDSEDSVNLTSDYISYDKGDDLIISKPIEINGEGHVLDCNESSIIVNSSNIVFNEVEFKNLNIKPEGNVSNLTFLNCGSPVIIAPSNISYPDWEFKLDTVGEISGIVKNLAKSIAGDSMGIEAYKKIADWVGRNIVHERGAGFYQSAYQTLMRKKGNCCSQTLLFLQMCDAIGAGKYHKMYFVHVGTMKFGSRHFFAIFDNYMVDVDSKRKDPWGHAKHGTPLNIYRITPYPYLPLPREY